MVFFKPGEYTFKITGTVGTKSAKTTFMMTLVDPCPTTTLTIINLDFFTDQTYILRDPKIDQLWDIDNLITKSTMVDCGSLSVDFFNDDEEQTTLDPDLFLDDRINLEQLNLTSLYTEDVQKVGLYPVKYRVYHTRYP